MPYFSSDLCSQMFSYDPTFYFSVEDKVLYPEDISDEISYASDSFDIEKEGFGLDSEAFYYHSIGDEPLFNQEEQAISKNDYFNYFWGENWLFSLKSSDDGSYAGEMEMLEAPHPDEEQAISRSYNYNHSNLEMLNSLNYESPCEDGLNYMHFRKNCYECFDDADSGNDDLYGCIADEELSGWLFGDGKDVQKLEVEVQSPGYGAATKVFELASQELGN